METRWNEIINEGRMTDDEGKIKETENRMEKRKE